MGATKSRLPFLLLGLGAIALTVAAGLMLFSSFMLYDDEGYVLLSLKNFAEHGGLYRDVYTQYGPFPYVLYEGLHLLGMPLTHTAGRILTLTAWSSAATLAAGLVWRVTRHSACMLAVLSAMFVYLWVMISEPSHPGGLIVLTTAIMGILGYRWLAAGRWSAWAGLAGVGSAILLLTKINIGVLATLSSLALLLMFSPNDRLRRAMPWLLAAGLAVLPFGLMRPLLGTPWVQTFALTFAFAALPVAGALGLAAGPRTGGRPWRAALLGGSLVAVVVVGVVFARGTTPAELLEGVLLGPLHHPGHFSLVFHWPPRVVMLAAVSLGIFLLAAAGLRLGRPGRVTVDTVVAGLRLAAAAGLGLAIWSFPQTSPNDAVFAYSLSCLWVFLWPLTGEAPAALTARAWLGLLFMGQWLHAFPVPGSQIAWGTFLAIPLATLGAWQAAIWLADQHGRLFTRARRQALDLVLTGALVAIAVLTGNRIAQIGARYLTSRPLDLPGAEVLRLPDSTTALYQLLVLNASVHSDMVFSLPGMFSFNLWSGRPTPTLTNVTHWFSLLDEAQQQAIIRALELHPRACVIVQQGHLDFLRARQLTPGGPLYDYVMSRFTTVFEIDGFQFRVRQGRRVAPLLTAEIYQGKTTGPAGAPVPDTLAKLQLLLPPGQTVGSVEIAQMDDPGRPPLLLNGTNTRVEITPIALEGGGRGATEAGHFPFALPGPAEVALYFDRGGRGFSTSRTYFSVRNPAGAELALVRLRP